VSPTIFVILKELLNDTLFALILIVPFEEDALGSMKLLYNYLFSILLFDIA